MPGRIMDPYAARNHMETYYGQIRSATDAVILYEACRLGALPRVQRRLSEKERQQIRSGSVFVWDEREAGMRRWTDGKSWSASRVNGSFLTYREMEGKKNSTTGSPTMDAAAPATVEEDSGPSADGCYRYKPDGLVKQSFSITTSSGQQLHLISYFARSQPHATTMPSPTSDPTLRHIRPAKGIYPNSVLNDPTSMPAVTRTPMGDAADPYLRNDPHLRNDPPSPFGWPPVPGAPSNMNGWPGGYFPYGFPMPKGMPMPWMHPAWIAQQMQLFAQQRSLMGLSSNAHPEEPRFGSHTAFDRIPGPLRNAQGGSLPPLAPPEPYSQHHPPSQQPNSNVVPSGFRPSKDTPAYQTSAAWYTQYQAWLQSQQQANHQEEQKQQGQGPAPAHTPSPSRHRARSDVHTQPQYAGDSRSGPQHSATLAPPVQIPPQHSGSLSLPPSQHNHTSAFPKHHSLPSITSLTDVTPSKHMSHNRAEDHSRQGPGPVQAAQYSHPAASAVLAHYTRPSEGQARAPTHQGHNSQGQSGLGADVNALRRLDRAFAP